MTRGKTYAKMFVDGGIGAVVRRVTRDKRVSGVRGFVLRD